jgi:IclR family transcriptional regulator, pca regulon regulatory protein
MGTTVGDRTPEITPETLDRLPEAPPDAPTDAPTEAPAEFVQSLERGLAVLRCFSREHPAQTLSDTARLAGLSRASARRFLHTLESLGYVRSDGRVFQLTPKVLDLGYAYVSSLNLSEIAQPFMEELSETVHESVSAAVLDGADIVYVARVPTKRIMAISISIGSRLPALVSSMGRVLLADLSEVELRALIAKYPVPKRSEQTQTTADALVRAVNEGRRNGWVLLDQELEEGLRSVAAPLHDRQGRTIAALNCSTHAGRVTLSELRGTILPELLSTAKRINEQLAKR